MAATWDRAIVREQLEQASGAGLSVVSALPDTLITKAQELGLGPADLELWIATQALEGGEFSAEAFAEWVEVSTFAWLNAADAVEVER